jgi:hypothetical protein
MIPRDDLGRMGLIHYVELGQLIVPWKEHKDFLRERKCSVLSRP